jgi:hypothetical protein
MSEISSDIVDNMRQEILQLRQIVKHLIDSIGSLESWRAEVTQAVAPVTRAAPPVSLGSGLGNSDKALCALRQAMYGEVQVLQARVCAAREREAELRCRYTALLAAGAE